MKPPKLPWLLAAGHYDRQLYLEWLFYWYLATVRLLVRIRDERI